MLEEFLKYIDGNHLTSKDGRILLAVSGGIDSMVMSHLFIEAGIEAGIAHCNFCLRAEESDKDEELVRRFADNNNMPFYLKRFDTRKFAGINGISVQMAARELRYGWFEQIREANNYKCIAVAHNLNDNIETLLINLTRGTGIAGLTGMKPKSNKIIRPLLFATRQKIAEYCTANKIAFREDMSNADVKYTRNKIRHLVIPLLQEINPSVETTLNDTTGKLGEVYDILSDLVNGIRKKVTEQKGDTIIFNINILKSEVQNRSLLFELFRPYGITETTARDLQRIVDGKTGSRVFTRTHRIIKNRSEIIVSPMVSCHNILYEISDIGSFTDVPEITVADYKEATGRFRISSDPSVASIDAGKLIFPVIVRKWRPGDFFYPLGMTKKKKISDYLIDEKYSLTEKENTLILESGGNIVWIIGKRLDNRYRITEKTKKALVLKVKT